MAQFRDEERYEMTQALIHSRQNISPRRLADPGPTASEMDELLSAAAAAPDHGELVPWRFVIVPATQRWRLAEVFGHALVDRDPAATAEQIANAREKAYRAPRVMLAIARLVGSLDQERAHGAATVKAHLIGDAERLVSMGCAIQNILLCAHSMGYGAGLTSGQAMASARLRALFGLADHEQAVCWINIGTVTKRKVTSRLRPLPGEFCSELQDKPLGG